MKYLLPFRNLHALLVFAALAFSCAPAEAAVIALYSFTGSSSDSGDADADSAAGTFTAGTGLPAASIGFETATGFNGTVRWAGADTLTTQANTVAAGDYFEFTISPASGFELDLTSLSLRVGASFTGGFIRGALLRSSIDSFATNVGNFQLGSTATVGDYTADLTGTSFQNLTATTTFRIYLYDGGASATTSHLRLDDVTLEGTVVSVPEPSAFALAGLGALAFGFLRRRMTT